MVSVLNTVSMLMIQIFTLLIILKSDQIDEVKFKADLKKKNHLNRQGMAC